MKLDQFFLLAISAVFFFLGAFLIFRNWEYQIVAIFVAMGILFVLATFFARKIRVYFSIVLLTTILSIVSFELVFQYRAAVGQNVWTLSDMRFEYLVARKEGRQKLLVNPSDVFTSRQIFLLGQIPFNLEACEEVPPPLITSLDQQGFRNPKNIWDLDDWQIAVIGDSFAFGTCVPDGDDMASILRSAYSRTANLGRPGSYPIKDFAILREYSSAYRPRLIVWFFFEGNDFRQSLQPPGDTLSVYLTDPSFTQNLLVRNGEILDASREVDRSEAFLTSLLHQAGFGMASGLQATLDSLSETDFETIGGRLTRQRRLHRARDYLDLALKLSEVRRRLGLFGRENIEFGREKSLGRRYDNTDFAFLSQVAMASRDLVASWGGQILVVYLPEITRYSSSSMRAFHDWHRAGFFDILEKLEIPYIDVASKFQEVERVEWLFAYGWYGGHYNSRGYALTAEMVLERIKGMDLSLEAR